MSRAISEDAFPSTATALFPINGWFIWKEARQLFPLMVALVLSAAAILLVHSELFTTWTRVDPLAILVFPGLFAVGAGTVLVGQEREQRTMDWLTSLPIASRYLIQVKIGVALVGLSLMWVLALLTLAVTGIGRDYMTGGRIAANLMPSISYSLWVVHSIYVMLCSFLASWRIKSQFVALIAVAPLACIPLFLCEFVLEGYYLSTGQHLKASANDWVRLIGSLVAVPVMGWLTYRTAMRVLMPQAAPRYRIQMRIHRLTETPRATRSVISQAPKFGSQITSIIWQSIHSARMVWCALFAMLMLGIYLPLAPFSSDASWHNRILVEFIAAFLAPLTVSWLGVSVFKNDGTQGKLRFMADRGVGPTKIYLGRHAVPIAIVAFGLIAYTMMATLQSPHQIPDWASDERPSMAAVALGCAVIYSVSQWTSQVIRMLILAAIVAPILSILVLSWWSFVSSAFWPPIWMLVAFAVMPMLATRRMMPRYMDGRDRPRAILLGFSITLMMLALPIIPPAWHAIKIVRSGEMAAYANLGQLRAEGLATIKSAPNVVRLRISYLRDGDAVSEVSPEYMIPGLAFDRSNARATRPDEFLPGLSGLRIEPESAATISSDTWHSLFARLTLERQEFEESPEPKESDTIEDFGSWIDAAYLVAQSLHRSPVWYDQEVADRMEIWLADTLNSPPLAPYRDAELFAAAKASAESHQKDLIALSSGAEVTIAGLPKAVGGALERWNSRATTPDEFLPGLGALRIEPNFAATIPADAWQSLYDRLVLERLKFEESPDPNISRAIEDFGPWVDAASLIAQALRRNPKWYDQEVADRLEVWLVDALNSPELVSHRDAELFSAAAKRFPGAEQRQKARRSGVLVSGANWSYASAKERLYLDRDLLADRLSDYDYELPYGLGSGMSLTDVVLVAIDTLDSDGASTNGVSWERRMHEAVFRERLPFALGPYAPRYRDLPSIATVEGAIRYPARHWGLPWEDEAAALKLAFSASTPIQGGDL